MKDGWRVTIERIEDGVATDSHMCSMPDWDQSNEAELPHAMAAAMQAACFFGGYDAMTQTMRSIQYLTSGVLPQLSALAQAWDAWHPVDDFDKAFRITIDAAALLGDEPADEDDWLTLDRASRTKGVVIENMPLRPTA